MSELPSIAIGVTADTSLILMRGFPEYLRDQGWDVHVVSSPGPHLDELARVAGVTAHAVPMARRPSPLADLKGLLRWVRLLRRIRPDVLSVGTPKAGLLGSLAGAIARVPSRVYVLRGLRLETARGPARLLLSALERLTSACAHVTVAVSPSLREEFVAMRLGHARKVVTIGAGSSNGVDLDAHRLDIIGADRMRAATQAVEALDGAPIIGFVGRLNADKGLSVLIAAREELVRRGVPHGLLIVGGVDDGPAGDTIREAPGIIVSGHIADPRPFYHLMTVLCLPTYREGFPNVVLEAAASGVPAVTTDATGAIDSVVHGETGSIVPVGSALALADELERLITDPRLASAMGERARERVARDFDRPKVWSEWASFYADRAEVHRWRLRA